jgi:hypothetical protein
MRMQDAVRADPQRESVLDDSDLERDLQVLVFVLDPATSGARP